MEPGMSSIRGRLSLKVVQARLTRDTEIFGKMDPYCVIKIGRVNTKTKTHKSGGKFPMWNSEFNIDIETDECLICEVWDADFFKSDDLVGTSQIDLRTALRGSNETQDWFELLYKGKKAGTIRLEMKYDLMTTYFGSRVTQSAQIESRSQVEDVVTSASQSLSKSITSIFSPATYQRSSTYAQRPESYIPQPGASPYPQAQAPGPYYQPSPSTGYSPSPPTGYSSPSQAYPPTHAYSPAHAYPTSQPLQYALPSPPPSYVPLSTPQPAYVQPEVPQYYPGPNASSDYQLAATLGSPTTYVRSGAYPTYHQSAHMVVYQHLPQYQAPHASGPQYPHTAAKAHTLPK